MPVAEDVVGQSEQHGFMVEIPIGDGETEEEGTDTKADTFLGEIAVSGQVAGRIGGKEAPLAWKKKKGDEPAAERAELEELAAKLRAPPERKLPSFAFSLIPVALIA